MFKLINRHTPTDSLSRVEDLVNITVDVQYTHITYETKDKLYEGELKPNKYFTHVGFIEAVSENIDRLQFIDGRAVFHLIDITMVEIPKPHDIDAMLKTIDDQQKEIAILRDVIDHGQLFDVRVLDQYTLADPIIGNREIDGIVYNLYEIKKVIYKTGDEFITKLNYLNRNLGNIGSKHLCAVCGRDFNNVIKLNVAPQKI